MIKAAEKPKRVVVQQQRTAAPSTKAQVGGKGPPEKPPLSAASASGSSGGETTFLVKAPRALLARLEKARVARGARSRNEAVVAILDEGAPK